MNSKKEPILIAHRGAPAYLPEHSLPSKALAYAMGADYLEQDVVATRDDELVVLHDIYLDRVSDVAERFSDRCRADGRFYVRDFDLHELRMLDFGERRNADGTAVYPDRFPVGQGGFQIHTFDEELAFLAALNQQSGGEVGCYPEIKRPAWHREEGVDITSAFLAVLAQHGYRKSTANTWVQCFDADELQRLRHELKSELKLVQLIGENDWHEGPTDFDALKTAAGLKRLARTVDAIGPWVEQLYEVHDGVPRPTDMVRDAHSVGLAVHPYTYRKDALPRGFSSFDELLKFSFEVLEVDGLFTDFADLVRNTGR